jgi:CRISPR-associated protein Cmr1
MSSAYDYVFEVTAASPTSVGWYEPNLSDKRFYLRPTSLKGVWRWWARAVVAGVLYDAGLLNCDKDGRCYAGGKELGSILGELGLGAGGENAVASKLKIEVEILQQPKECQWTKTPYQRIRLLSIKRDTPPFFIEGKFRVKLRGYKVPLVQDVSPAVKLFLLATTLGGVGKGSRKGLGSLDVLYTNLKLDGVYKNLEFESDVAKLLESVRNDIAKLLNVELPTKGGQPGLAPATLISRSNTEIYLITCRDCRAAWPCHKSCLISIHNFFTRVERQRVLRTDPLRHNTDAWILGLPRHVKKLGTGYFGDVDRRASPFILSYHESHVVGGRGPYMYLTVIKSRDWPKELEWEGGRGSRHIQINDNTLVNDYKISIDAFRDYAKASGCIVKRVW